MPNTLYLPSTPTNGPSPEPKYQLLAPLRAEELAALEADILKRGMLLPVETDEDGYILDGHHRAAIAARHGLPCPTLVRRFASEQEKREHAIKMNLARRHLDPLRWGQAFKLLLEERGVHTTRGPKPGGAISATVAEIADELGVPERTARHRVRQAEQYEALPAPLKAEVDAGGLTVPQAQRLVQRAQKRDGLAERAAQARQAAPWSRPGRSAMATAWRSWPRSRRAASAWPSPIRPTTRGSTTAREQRPTACRPGSTWPGAASGCGPWPAAWPRTAPSGC
jgi:hypothetical protein